MMEDNQQTGGSFERPIHDAHEVYEALCALSLAGELSPADQSRLHLHLKHCTKCCELLSDLERLTLDVMPVLGAELADEKPWTAHESVGTAVEQRLLAALDVEDIPSPAPRKTSSQQRRIWYVGAVAATLVLGLGVGAGLMRVYLQRQERTVPSPVQTVRQAARRDDRTSQDQLMATQHQLKQEEQKTAVLQNDLAGLRTALGRRAHDEAILQRQLDEDQSRLEVLTQEKTQLSERILIATEQAQQLRQTSNQNVVQENQRNSKLALLESQIKQMQALVDDKDRALKDDQELLAHDRDIRDLIGARNVYMAEVYDVDERGKTKKPFGRVFYTRDKSLIFYGYDLDQQPNLTQAVAFQGWGSFREGQNVNLGLFYQDESKKRWILKFNDAKTLARLNSVFVTVEPKGGSEKPTGKPLMFTFLKMEANHP